MSRGDWEAAGILYNNVMVMKGIRGMVQKTSHPLSQEA